MGWGMTGAGQGRCLCIVGWVFMALYYSCCDCYCYYCCRGGDGGYVHSTDGIVMIGTNGVVVYGDTRTAYLIMVIGTRGDVSNSVMIMTVVVFGLSIKRSVHSRSLSST